ncbi:MAG TPA: hypothetical protein V6C81_01885 [Planktothrix sp.]|jgi:hypothetical protein
MTVITPESAADVGANPASSDLQGESYQSTTTLKRTSSRWVKVAATAAPYVLILLLQLKILGDLRNWDLTPVDTSYYFIGASRWHDFGRGIDPAYYPLYQVFFGSMLFIKNDAYFALLAHRVLILGALSISILAVFRRVLPKKIALLSAAWWTLAPIDYLAYVEVHLFGFLFSVIACLIASRNTVVARGIAVSWLLLSGLLIRTEAVVGAVALACCALFYDVWLAKSRGVFDLRKVLLSYGVPVVIAASAVLALYSISDKSTELRLAMLHKDQLAASQLFAFSFLDRHPFFGWDPSLEAYKYIELVFHRQYVSFTQAFVINPLAMVKHCLFNLALAPISLQMLLFGDSFPRAPGDFGFAAHSRRTIAAAVTLSCLSVSLLITAAVKCLKKDKQWLNAFKRGGWPAITMCCTAASSAVTMLVGRPRPEYIFNLGLFLMWMISVSAWMLFQQNRVRHDSSRFKLLPEIAVLCAILIVPSSSSPCGTRLAHLYELFKPFKSQIDACQLQHRKLIWPFPIDGIRRYGTVESLLNYVLGSHRTVPRPVPGFDGYWGIFTPKGPDVENLDHIIARIPKGKSLSSQLENEEAGLLAIDDKAAKSPLVAQFMRSEHRGWTLSATQTYQSCTLWLYLRDDLSSG